MKMNTDDLYLIGLVLTLPVLRLFMKKNIKSAMLLPLIASLPVYIISSGSEALFPTPILFVTTVCVGALVSTQSTILRFAILVGDGIIAFIGFALLNGLGQGQVNSWVILYTLFCATTLVVALLAASIKRPNQAL